MDFFDEIPEDYFLSDPVPLDLNVFKDLEEPIVVYSLDNPNPLFKHIWGFEDFTPLTTKTDAKVRDSVVGARLATILSRCVFPGLGGIPKVWAINYKLNRCPDVEVMDIFNFVWYVLFSTLNASDETKVLGKPVVCFGGVNSEHLKITGLPTGEIYFLAEKLRGIGARVHGVECSCFEQGEEDGVEASCPYMSQFECQSGALFELSNVKVNVDGASHVKYNTVMYIVQAHLLGYLIRTYYTIYPDEKLDLGVRNARRVLNLIIMNACENFFFSLFRNDSDFTMEDALKMKVGSVQFSRYCADDGEDVEVGFIFKRFCAAEWKEWEELTEANVSDMFKENMYGLLAVFREYLCECLWSTGNIFCCFNRDVIYE